MKLCSFPAPTSRRIGTNDWVTGLDKPALVSSPFYLISFVPFQVCKKMDWIGHGLSSPTKTVRWRTKQQTAVLAAWTIEKRVSWMVQTVFTEVPNLLWLHMWVQSANELFHTYWACFGCLLTVTGFWKTQIMVPSYLFQKHTEEKAALKNMMAL